MRSLKEVSDQTKGSIHLIVPLPGLSRAIFESQDSLFKEIKDMIMSRKIDVFVVSYCKTLFKVKITSSIGKFPHYQIRTSNWYS